MRSLLESSWLSRLGRVFKTTAIFPTRLLSPDLRRSSTHSFGSMIFTTDDHLVKILYRPLIHSWVTKALAPTPFSGTTSKGRLLVVRSPSVEPCQLWTEQRSEVKPTGRETISSSSFDSSICPTWPRTLQVARDLICERVETADQLSTDSAGFGLSVPLLE